MRDPHIRSLKYDVEPCKTFHFNNPTSIRYDHPIGEFALSDGELTVSLKVHFAETLEARRSVELVLKAWEIQAALARNLPVFRFVFKEVEVVDLNPAPMEGENRVIELEGHSRVELKSTASCEVTCSVFPDPPISFSVTPEIEIAYNRWMRSKRGEEPLLGMAYFVLTLIERAAGGRQQASRVYSVELSILRELGRITSTLGDSSTARKVDDQSTFAPLSDLERAWVELVVKVLIKRMGEHAAGATVGMISMSDLPPL